MRAPRTPVTSPVRNIISECYDGNGKPITPTEVAFVVVHRISLRFKTETNRFPIPDADLDGKSLAAFFRDHRLGTGGRPPYHLLIRKDPLATTEQMIPLLVRGAHARGYNSRSFSIAVAGDFRSVEPTSAQHARLVRVCRVLCRFNHGLQIVGHTELPGASADPAKICPGKYLPLGPVIAKACVCVDRPMGDPKFELEQEGFVL